MQQNKNYSATFTSTFLVYDAIINIHVQVFTIEENDKIFFDRLSTFDKGPPWGSWEGITFLQSLISGSIKLPQIIDQCITQIHFIFKWHASCSVHLPTKFNAIIHLHVSYFIQKQKC